MTTFHLTVVTPDGCAFDGQAERIVCRAIDGDIAILAKHGDYCTALGMGDNPVAFFLPVLPAVLVGLVCVLVISAFLGAGEKKRIGAVALQAAGNTEQELTEEQKALCVPTCSG